MDFKKFKRGSIVIKEGDVFPGFVVNRKPEYWEYCVAGQDLYFNSVEGVFVLCPVNPGEDKPWMTIQTPKGCESNPVCDEVFETGYGSEYDLIMWCGHDMSELEARVTAIKNPDAGVTVVYCDDRGNKLVTRDFNNTP